MRTKILIVLAVTAMAAALLAFKPLTGVKSGTTACGVAATAITSGDGYSSIALGNLSATPVFIGGSAVTTSNGWPICTDTASCHDTALSLDTYQGQLYCIVASATTTVSHLSGH